MLWSWCNSKENKGLENDRAFVSSSNSSINDGKEEFTLRYATIDNAVRMITRVGSSSLLAKKSAFCTLPVRVEERELLGIHWRQKYYVDCCLPFRLRSAPLKCNQYAEVLEWTLHNYLISNIIHRLDNFLIVGKPSSAKCETALQKCYTYANS